ncbi:MAG: hypothetical protein ABT940_04840 [Alphaproteobacteria bacterium]
MDEEKKALLAELEKVVTEIRTSTSIVIAMWPRKRGEYRQLMSRCVRLQGEIKAATQDNVFYCKKNEAGDAMMDFRQLNFETSTFPGSAVVLSFVAIMIGILELYDIPQLSIEEIFNKNAIKLIPPAFLGTIIYFFTGFLEAGDNPRTSRLEVFVNRFLVAVFIPAAIVILLQAEKTDAGLSVSFRSTPEAFSFLCGYSAKLVTDTLKKLVDRVSTMIRAF